MPRGTGRSDISEKELGLVVFLGVRFLMCLAWVLLVIFGARRSFHGNGASKTVRRNAEIALIKMPHKFLRAEYIYICHIIVPIGALLKRLLDRIVLIRNGKCLASITLPYLFPAQKHYLENLCIPMNISRESLALYL